MGSVVEADEAAERSFGTAVPPAAAEMIHLTMSETEPNARDDGDKGLGKRARAFGEGVVMKRPKLEAEDSPTDVLTLGFLDPFTPEMPPLATIAPALAPILMPMPMSFALPEPSVVRVCRNFWNAGEYEGLPMDDSTSFSVGIDHVRVHPKFLHSNATSHKWALGALAELLDNSLDEVCNGATFVNIDMLENRKSGTKMLLVEDDGGGMDPDGMRQCMSLGYSLKSKSANTIGQYGNGFKTSTMRLGADVIVFSRSCGKHGQRATQSIGMLSYTFLRTTGKEDIVVPIIDYEKEGEAWSKMKRCSSVWNNNLETIIQWSPYFSEADLLQQFSSMSDQGTRIVIYNLWEDDQGELELDFGADIHDIQIRGVNRDEKKIEMFKKFPNSRHFLTYRHSLRSYASILYLRIPPSFRMILRGKEVEHHNLVDDMLLKHEVVYKPQPVANGLLKDSNMVAVVTVGFVKDAKDHIDVQGFNVYHKNRLIKPFWRVWNAAGSDGRGVIGVLEANFVEPAHDKQDFERTTVLSRLEARLVKFQREYWSKNCHQIGYAPRCKKKLVNDSEDRVRSLEAPCQPSFRHSRKETSPSKVTPEVSKSKNFKHQNTEKFSLPSNHNMGKADTPPVGSEKLENLRSVNGHDSFMKENGLNGAERLENMFHSPQSIFNGIPHALADLSDSETEYIFDRRSEHELGGSKASPQKSFQKYTKATDAICNGHGTGFEDTNLSIEKLTRENEALKKRIKEMEDLLDELQYERDRNKSLTKQLEAVQNKLEEANKEQDALTDIFQDERNRKDKVEDSLRKELKAALATIQDLSEKLNYNNNVKLEN
ncbi:protein MICRORCHIDIA 7-like [Phoenix dactylifera]|uniref:Protein MICRORCHIDIA 7-like n=1 Tax=Phoenix dactylifera TaxID=42345 RepID=A0A8B7C393_PHODC|nr:protein MICRORCHIDIA 7-like [Phoenix dactylifera]